MANTTEYELDTLDYMSLFLMGNTIEIVFPDGETMIAESEDEISFYDDLATFRVVKE